MLRNSRDWENPSLPKLLDRWISTRKRPPEASYHPPVVSRAAPSCASMFLVGLKSVAMTRGDKNGEKGWKWSKILQNLAKSPSNPPNPAWEQLFKDFAHFHEFSTFFELCDTWTTCVRQHTLLKVFTMLKVIQKHHFRWARTVFTEVREKIQGVRGRGEGVCVESCKMKGNQGKPLILSDFGWF